MMRSATVDDAVALAQLDAQCNPSAWTIAQFTSACQSDNVYLLETDDGELQGLIVWQTILDEMELHLIATAPEYRRQGLASQLLTLMMQMAQSQAISRILLEVRASNVGAQALYVQHGFSEIARRKNYYGGVEDAIIMEKRLC